jgi:nicotinate phosphoribosyltransferase
LRRLLTISGLSTVRLQQFEREALAKACPYFPDSYLDFLAGLVLKPEEQVALTFHPTEQNDWGTIQCAITGLWRECILYEVPIMSISEHCEHLSASSILNSSTPLASLWH